MDLMEFSSGFDMRRRFGANGEIGIGDFVGGAVADDVAKIVDLSGAKSGSGVERHQQPGVSVTTDSPERARFRQCRQFEMKSFGTTEKPPPVAESDEFAGGLSAELGTSACRSA